MSQNNHRPNVAKYIRWGFVCIAVAVVAVRLGVFIDAATTEAPLVGISISVDRAEGKTLLLPLNSGASLAEAEQMPNVQSYTVRRGESLWANTTLETDFTKLPGDLRGRLRMASFVATGDGGQIRPLEAFSERECRIKAGDVGTYYIIAYLPPVSVSTRKSEQINIGKFMRQNGGAQCVAVKITIVDAPGGNAEPTGIWEKSKLPILNLHQNKDTNLVTVQPIMIPQVLPPPVPYVEPEPDPMEAKRDMGEKKDGVDDASDEHATTSDNVAEDFTPSAETKRVPPAEIVKREKILTPGTLPETSMQFEPNDIKALNAHEWYTICEEYDMRFVCSPTDDSERPATGKFIVMTPDGSKEIMDYEEVRTEYGVKVFRLDQLSDSVYRNTVDCFNDPDEWYYCTKIRGFLINNLLLQAVDDAVQERKLTKVDLQKIKRVDVRLHIVDKTSGKSITVEVLDVVLHEGMEGERPREPQEARNE